jgi:hypothetical protein
LWYYVLREADVFEGGAHLGPAGDRIVAEVFLGLLQADPDSYLNRQPDFAPSLGPASGTFTSSICLLCGGCRETLSV